MQGIEVGDRVIFREPGFPLTGMRGRVEGSRPFALLVLFDNGSVSSWQRDYFEKETKMEDVTVKPPKAKRGFAAMDPEKRREISARGGKKAHELGVAHRFTSQTAELAGAKGGSAYHRKRGKTVIEGEGQEKLPE